MLKITYKHTALLLFVVCLLPINTAIAAEKSVSTNSEQKNIKLLLTKLGTVALVKDIPITIETGLLQKQRENAAKKNSHNKKIIKIVNEFFASEKILHNITTRLTKTTLNSKLQSARYNSINKLLNSKNAAKLVALKKKSRSSSAITEIEKLAAQQKNSPLTKARLRLFDSFDNAAAETEFSIAAQALSIDAIQKISDSTMSPNDIKQKKKTNQDMLQISYQLLLEPSKYATMLTLQYMFKAISSEEINQYILIYRQKQMQWLLQNIMRALSDAMQEAANNAIREIKKLQ